MRILWQYICLLMMLVTHSLAVTASEPNWQCNAYAYQYDMTVYANLNINQKIVDPDQFILAAFCGEECRGIASVDTTEHLTYYYLRIRSNKLNGENISFRVYDKTLGKEVLSDWLKTTIIFESDSRIGFPSNLYTIVFNSVPEYYMVSILPSPHGTVRGGGKVTEGSEIILTATPNEGYEFTEWTDGTRINPYIFKVTEDKNIGAVFIPKKYRISYIIGSDTIFTDSVTFQEPITAPEVPEKEGYRFGGWTGLPSEMPACDIEIFGEYIVNQYAIKYYVENKIYAIDSLEYGKPIFPIAEPVKDGFQFSGWKNVPDLMPAHDIRIDGIFTVISGVEMLSDAKEQTVDLYSIKGDLLKRKVSLERVIEGLPKGIYVINGKKFLISP